MSNPNAPRLIRGGLVLIDPDSPRCSASSRCNTTRTRSRARCRCRASPTRGDRSEALRLKGPPVETIKLEAEIDATDQLEQPRDPNTIELASFRSWPRWR